jgi:hypothetical protein
MNLQKNLLCCLLATVSLLAHADDNQTMQLEGDSTSNVSAYSDTENTSNEVSHPQNDNSTLVEAPPAPVVKPGEEQDFASAWGVAVGGGTLGISFNLAHALYSDYLDIRGQYNYMPINNVNIQDNDMAVNFNTYGLLLDYKPLGGVFRITGGVYGDGRKFSVQGSNIDIGDGMSGSGNAGISFPAMSPYLGIGLGSFAASTVDKKGFLIAFDAGVMFSKASAYANLTCNDSGNGSCNGFDDQTQEFIDQMNSTFAAFPFYPVLSLNFGYRF